MKEGKLEEVLRVVDRLRDRDIDVSLVLSVDYQDPSEWLEVGEPSCRAKLRMDFSNPEECRKKLATIADLKLQATDTGIVKGK